MKKILKAALSAIVLMSAMQTVSAQTRVPVTFVSGSTDVAKEGAAMVCDGHLYTKWCIDQRRQMPYSVVLDAGSPVALTAYGLCTGDDAHSYPDRNPLDWRVSGSNDKSSWTVIDLQKYNRSISAENEQEFRFPLKDAGAYRYYRLEFLRMMDGTRFQLSEINLYK